MVVTLKHHINSEIREQSAELTSHADNIIVVIMRAVGIKRLVEHNDFPLCVARLDIVFQPFKLGVAELIVNDIVGVEHREMNAVIIV